MFKINIYAKIHHIGKIDIIIKNKKTGFIRKKKTIFNQITDNFLNELTKQLLGNTPDCKIEQLAIGTGLTLPSVSDTQLVNETYRTPDTDLYQSGTGEVTSAFILDGFDYTALVPSGEIEEIGFFCGSSALSWGGGAGINTGLLISRVLFSEIIEADESLYINRTDKFIAG